MPFIESKFIKNKPFFYISEKVKIKNNYKKIRVYIGDVVPKDLDIFYNILAQKEIEFMQKSSGNLFVSNRIFTKEQILKLETLRIYWKYLLISLSDFQKEQLWRQFAVQFIFESNAIEGSRLSQQEVNAIVRKKYVKKSLERNAIQEVRNAIKAFELIQSKKFRLHERSLKVLHSLVTTNLDVKKGYKTHDIIVNNKRTVPVGEIRASLSRLVKQWKKQKKEKKHTLEIAAHFHNRFEYVHPFEDGNGRVGRLLFNWMLIQAGYPPILFRYKNRQTYFEALNQADEGRTKKWYWFCIRVYKQTAHELLENSKKKYVTK